MADYRALGGTLRPCAEIVVSRKGLRQPLTALIDTGSDTTTIPSRALRALQANSYTKIATRDFSGRQGRTKAYLVNLEIEGERFEALEVLETSGIALIGRDVLSRFQLYLDESEKAVTLTRKNSATASAPPSSQSPSAS